MKVSRPYPSYVISKKGAKWLMSGHPWVYEGEIPGLKDLEEGPEVENGDLVDVISEKGTYLGTGFLSLKSKIRIRLLSRNANDLFDRDFWKRRFAYAWAYRKQVMAPADLKATRLIFGEADQLPGLTVDRFNDILVAQCLSYGMDRRKALLYPLLLEVLREDGQDIKGIYERNDDELRSKEGLAQGQGWFNEAQQGLALAQDICDKTEPGLCQNPAYLLQEGSPADSLAQAKVSVDPAEGNLSPKHGCLNSAESFAPSLPTTTQIEENGIRYLVDVANGQKTGFFLDQKLNRRRVADLARGMEVLDCFTHTGAFAMNALKGGACHVSALDISDTAIAMARKNAELNGLLDGMDFITANAFDFLEEQVQSRRHPWNFIILDPPAFTKSRQTVGNAGNGYRRINELALRLLPRGGYLATCTCSHFMPAELFLKEVNQAAHDAGVHLKQIEARQQAPDHPILLDVPETAYLKFFIFQAI